MIEYHYLKAPDSDTLTAALIAAGVLTTQDDAPPVPTDGYALDVIGEITKTDDEGNATPIDGWHANLAGHLADDQRVSLAAVLMTTPPANPVRVWA